MIKIFKLVIISAVVLFALITALSLLLPSHVRISRAVNIIAPPEMIIGEISNINEWKKWNRFVILADSMKTLKTISNAQLETDVIAVDLREVKGDTVKTNWRQNNGRLSHSNFALVPGNNYTVVQWYFDFHLQWYPWQKFQSIIYDKQLGPHMEASLQNLKHLVESTN